MLRSTARRVHGPACRTMSPPPTQAMLDRRSPLWASAAITWIDNLGAATALIGIYFVARLAYEFTPAQSLGLGLVQGITYVLAAICAGPGMRLLAGPQRPISTRTLLALLHVLLAAACTIPVVWRSPQAMWVTVAIYTPITGWLWPAIESFLSAGRTGRDLRRSSGWFNIAWASCQVFTFWFIAPFMEKQPLWAIPVMGLSHLLAIPLIMMLRREPAAHGDAAHHHSREEVALYRRLLNSHRLLLILSYIVYSSMNPLLPAIEESLALAAFWMTPVISIWMVSRVGMFWWMGAWGGWHGRAFTLAWPSVLLLSGFAMCMLAGSVPVFCVGLVLFGTGMGAIYSAAFYYAMEVGSAGVDAGGKHEALIGVGYAVGPFTGIVASEATRAAQLSPVYTRVGTFVLVLAIAAGFGTLILRALLRAKTRSSL